MYRLVERYDATDRREEGERRERGRGRGKKREGEVGWPKPGDRVVFLFDGINQSERSASRNSEAGKIGGESCGKSAKGIEGVWSLSE